MNSIDTLAIVMPAYKLTFLEKALESIAKQTCKDFTLYIGDDKSPFDLYSVVKKYESRITIVYQRFAENAGGKNLISQWNRCIDMTNNERWIWLFSDDDVMEENCVEVFFSHVQQNPNEDLLHFNVDVIDHEDKIIDHCASFPERISSSDFFREKTLGFLRSFVVEYIFSRDVYNRKKGFEYFDLAWGSDDATWIKFGFEKGIYTIKGAKVLWRHSNENITPNMDNKDIALRKSNSIIEYFKWAKDLFELNNITEPLTPFRTIKGIILQLKITDVLTFKEKLKIVSQAIDRLNLGFDRYPVYMYLYYSCIKETIERAIKR